MLPSKSSLKNTPAGIDEFADDEDVLELVLDATEELEGTDELVRDDFAELVVIALELEDTVLDDEVRTELDENELEEIDERTELVDELIDDTDPQAPPVTVGTSAAAAPLVP